MALNMKKNDNDPISSLISGVAVAKIKWKSLYDFTSYLLNDVNWSEMDQTYSVFNTELIECCFEMLQERKPKVPKVAIYLSENSVLIDGELRKSSVINVLNDDMPFLLDSLLGELQDRRIKIHNVRHPVLRVKRDKKGKLLGLVPPSKSKDDLVGMDGIKAESFVSVEVDALKPETIKELQSALEGLCARVGVVVKDWLLMRNRLTSTASDLSSNPSKVPLPQLSEAVQFLRWANENNFTFLGMREYSLKGKTRNKELLPKRGSGLGILRDRKVEVLRRGKELTHMTPEVRKFFFSPSPIIITKANIKSDVHRRSYMDYIGIKLYDEKGKITGELKIVGLFTSSAYASTVTNIPILRQKLDYVLTNSGAERSSHSGKALTNIVETFPRDELFQISNEMLGHYASEIEKLDHSPEVKVLQRVDEFDRFVSVMVFLPRDQFSTEIRGVVGEYLAKMYKGRVSAFYPFFAEGPYVRIHYIIGRDKGKTPNCPAKLLEKEIESLSRRWEDRMYDEIVKFHDGDEAELLVDQYGSAFPVGYRDIYETSRLMDDIHIIEEMDEDHSTNVAFYHKDKAGKDCLEVTLYNLGEPIPLSRRVPIFENLGFDVIDERSYTIKPNKGRGQAPVCQHMMRLQMRGDKRLNLAKLKQQLVDAFMAVWKNEAANDGYNQLISILGFEWREAALLRGFGSYLRQINIPYDQDYLISTLVRHSEVTKLLVELFHCRFDPAQQKASIAKAKRINKKINDIRSTVPSLDEDQILSHFQNLVMVALRTNYYHIDKNGETPDELVLKFDSQKIEGVPAPKPFREIFVYSPKIEGVHLRFGKIARGGLRWSDRQQDFRTEVLGLVKAQLVKNSVIVPTGSKGGFVPKNMPLNPSREEFMACGIEAYKRFINGLLSITDNMVGKVIVPPQNTVRYDEDDPYLVVAADKGTATFSDIANEISCSRAFWLGDAFASGGSQGYDHKVMGITARGAWEAVKRHFRERNINIQRQPIKVIGVGDMSGDVFGNGMLLSKALKLQAAFDHRDIFIDPEPEPKSGWKERKRLFEQGRSSWQDYDTKLFSKGGGVFSRSAKSVKLSAEIMDMLGVSQTEMSPNALIKAILKSEADLLWFGGIGTYIKGRSESNADVGDRANDGVRVSADELKVSVIGEGANLGITQEGRMEFASLGNSINTDAIDNSAGVNSSDLEVNIKIALGQAISNGRLSIEKRNKVLSSMTEQVAERCLENNYLQSLTLSLGQLRGVGDLGFQKRLMRHLESKGLMSRDVEGLPEDIEIAERLSSGVPLTRPELATLLGFAKIDLFNELIESDVVDDSYFNSALKTYFPEGMQKEFALDIKQHPLRREIIGTQLTNSMINRGGSTMVVRLTEETGRSSSELAAAFTVASDVLGFEDIYTELDQLDNKMKGLEQLEVYKRLQSLTRRMTAWFLNNGSFEKGLSKEIKLYKTGLSTYMKKAKAGLSIEQQTVMNGEVDALIKGGVPEKLAQAIADIFFKASGLDVVLAAKSAELAVTDLIPINQSVDEKLQLAALSRMTDQVPHSEVYDLWALNALVNRIETVRRQLIAGIGRSKGGFDGFEVKRRDSLERVNAGITEILDAGEISLSKLIVAVGHLDEITA